MIVCDYPPTLRSLLKWKQTFVMMTMEYKIGRSGRIVGLYDIAKEKTWNAGKDLQWNTLTTKPESPVNAGRSPFCEFTGYEQLSGDSKALADWRWHAVELSEILHGEQGALLISSQLVELLPSMDAKLFASSQVFDEARHVEFFTRYLGEHVGYIAAPSPELKTLLENALADDQVDTKLITMQIVIESLAMAKFQRLRTETAVPLLQVALEYILKDEARHVSFGTEVLRARHAALDADARNARARYVLETVISLANSLNAATVVADEFGWDRAELRRHLRAKRIADPSEARAIFRQLQINLSTIGLLTDELKEKLSSRGLLTEPACAE